MGVGKATTSLYESETIMTTVEKTAINREVTKLLNKANNAAKNASTSAVQAADLAVSLSDIRNPMDKMNAIKAAYQVTLKGMAGSVKETFAARVAVSCFPNVKVEVRLNKTEIKERLADNPKSKAVTKTISASEATTRHDLNAAAKQVREAQGIATKAPTKASNVVKVNMAEFKTSLNIIMGDKALVTLLRSALKEHGYGLSKTRAVKAVTPSLINSGKALVNILEQSKKGSTTHVIN